MQHQKVPLFTVNVRSELDENGKLSIIKIGELCADPMTCEVAHKDPVSKLDFGASR